MKKPLVVLLAVTLALTSIGATGKEAKDTPPDMTKIIRLVGKSGMAHACPIAPHVALTNSHVVDVQRPFAPYEGLQAYRFENYLGQSHVATGVGVANNADLAVMRLGTEVPYYIVSKTAPASGDRVWWMAYDWTNRKSVAKPKVMSGKVVTAFAGHIFLEDPAVHGSSGSCVLNSSGEVVGILAFGLPVGSGDALDVSAGIVGVWGDWLAPADKIESNTAPKNEEATP